MGPLTAVEFLGAGFNRWVFPTSLFLMVILTITNCRRRILNCIGFEQYDFNEDYAEGKVIEGKQVIERYKKEIMDIQSGIKPSSPASGLLSANDDDTLDSIGLNKSSSRFGHSDIER
jgi:hypothetical protein